MDRKELNQLKEMKKDGDINVSALVDIIFRMDERIEELERFVGI